MTLVHHGKDSSLTEVMSSHHGEDNTYAATASLALSCNLQLPVEKSISHCESDVIMVYRHRLHAQLRQLTLNY